jgi:serine phosphatase RsbU (regulator of sigma subunit)
MGDAFSIEPRRLLLHLVVDVAFSAFSALIALLLLYYLHDEWQPNWAVGCGVLAGAGIRRAVAPTYASFPGFLRRPLALGVVVAATTLVVSTTMAAPRYGGIISPYLLARYPEALTLLTVTVSLGLGAAGIIYSHTRLMHEVEERQRLQEDVRLARGIQQSLLSNRFPKVPWVDAWAFNLPSRDVGGDYYEIFEGDAGGLEFAIGDVSGKGVPAALLMSTLQSAFLGVIGSDPDLARACARVNRFLFERTAPERYATFFVGRLGTDASLSYVNAGHNPPLLVRSDELQRLSGGGMPLGLFANAGYELQNTRLAPGDLLLCYTDGVTEAVGPDDEEFGEERLLAVARAQLGNGAEQVVTAVHAAVEAHTRGTPQFDDLTLLAVCLR